ncbi:MAG: hypothetical protein M3T96_07370, partial [Acidobacteriota bacterium]|nr:hypothetical protein [Acidobacteriota bacterium]
ADLKPAHSKILNEWLAAHKGWRLALGKDYGSEYLKNYRQQEGANAQPFYAVQDFNADKKEDFAVILIKGKMHAVIVFNAPFNAAKPAFFTTEIEADDILYYNKNSKLLLVGPYESDAGFMLKPRGKTYQAAYFDG